MRVGPRTFSRLAKPSHHEANGCEAEESERGAAEVLPVLGETPAAVEPCNGAFDDPSPGQHLEALRCVSAPDNLDLHLAQHTLQRGLELRPLVAGIGVELAQEWEHPEQRCHHQHAAVAILQAGGVHHRMQHQAERVDQDVPLAAFDLLAAIVAMGVDRRPPFSAPFTLWLSMIAAVGLALRHDHGSNFMAEHFQKQARFWGISPSYAFVAEPETNGVIERFFRTLKEQAIDGRVFQTIDEVRDAVRNFAARYNAEWLIGKNGYLSPLDARTARLDTTLRRAA
jgi:hypothetical protein